MNLRLPGWSVLREFLEEATIKAARSTVLQALQWFLGLTLGAIVLSVMAKAPAWLIVLLSVFASGGAVVFIGAFIYLLMHDRDALRSEKYLLTRTAIDKGLIGDSLSGLGLLDGGHRQGQLGAAEKDDGNNKQP